MRTLAATIFVILAGLAALRQIFADPRILRRIMVNSRSAVAVFCVQATIGLVAIFLAFPRRPEAAAGAVWAAFGWIAFSGLSLIRTARRLREPPAWFMRFGVIDVLCLIAVAAGARAAFAAFG